MTGAWSGAAIVDTVANDYGVPADVVTGDLVALSSFLYERGYIDLLQEESAGVSTFVFQPDGRTHVVHADIELTRECDLSCVYCYADASRHQRDVLDVSAWRRLLTVLADQGLRAVKVSGGEPYLYPSFTQFFEYCAEHFVTSLNSNGTHIDAEQATWLKSLDLQAVQISLDSMNASTHDAQRGRGTWKLARRAIDALSDRNVPLRISCTVTSLNQNEIEPIREFAAHVGAELSLEIMRSRGRAERLAESYFAEICENDWRGSVGSAYRHLDPLEFRCQAQLGFVGLSAQGKLKPCNLIEPFFMSMGAQVVQPIADDFDYTRSHTFRGVSAACDRRPSATDAAETCVLAARSRL